MTLLEKIKNYKWFDSPNKLKPILEELYNSSGGGSGGGTQDLQSVLYEGNTTDNEFYNLIDLNDSTVVIKTGVINSIGGFNKINGIELKTSDITSQVGFENGEWGYIRSYISGTERYNHNLGFYLPFLKANPSYPNIDIYTLATLDDIKKINLSDRIYANNAAAISGGLTVNDIYRTSTGELRIVV